MKNIFALTFFYFLLTYSFATPLTTSTTKKGVAKVEHQEANQKLSKKELRKLEKSKRKLTNKKEKIIAFFEKIYANTPLTIGIAALLTGGLLALVNHFLFLGIGFFSWITIGLLLGGIFLVIFGLKKNK